MKSPPLSGEAIAADVEKLALQRADLCRVEFFGNDLGRPIRFNKSEDGKTDLRQQGEAAGKIPARSHRTKAAWPAVPQHRTAYCPCADKQHHRLVVMFKQILQQRRGEAHDIERVGPGIRQPADTDIEPMRGSPSLRTKPRQISVGECDTSVGRDSFARRSISGDREACQVGCKAIRSTSMARIDGTYIFGFHTHYFDPPTSRPTDLTARAPPA